MRRSVNPDRFGAETRVANISARPVGRPARRMVRHEPWTRSPLSPAAPWRWMHPGACLVAHGRVGLAAALLILPKSTEPDAAHRDVGLRIAPPGLEPGLS